MRFECNVIQGEKKQSSPGNALSCFISTDFKKIPRSFTQNFDFSEIEKFDFWQFAKLNSREKSIFFIREIKFPRKFLPSRYFSSFTGLKPNLSKCEVAGIGALKEAKVAICGMMWTRRNLTLEGKIIIFKALALSKVTFLAQVLVIPNQIIDALQQKQKIFMEYFFPESET